ncbi:MAG: DEAD/DEAH box helicase [Planctomycetes bacterium]|nr:DEAD/DEAH box helicase [Planctomycetota bacterium]
MAKQLKQREHIGLLWSLDASRSALSTAVGEPELAPQSTTVDLNVAPAGVVSSPLASVPIRTIGCVFEQGATRRVPGREQGVRTAKQNAQNDDAPCSMLHAGYPRGSSLLHAPRYTRIRPPRDVVKLEDRLRLLLQPPLESLLAARALRFAFPPFGYQLDGIAFLYPRHEAVLADEMGLGKTMQAITAIRLLVHQHQVRRVLLICPKPLVSNWQREFAQWAPELPVSALEGGPVRRQWRWREGGDVVTIANYETVVRDRAEVCHESNHYDLVVLDESQRIKNVSSTTNEVVRSIHRSRSWALTGTPIENSVEDLAGIFEFVAPGQVDAKMKPRAVGRAISDHILRRSKDAVLSDLPPKLFRDADVELTPEQAESYRLAEDEGVVQLREMKHALTIGHVFELVLRLKQICNFDPTTGASCKMERLEADVEECAASGQKAIVFSQWVQTLEELRERLERFNPAEYHGQVPNRHRDSAIERFRDDPGCHLMLMTYGAGSVGLNLQFASYVFLFDRWWNPAVEDQAINRAHRIGVKRSVTVTRFLAVNTIEQRINEILERKRELFDSVFNESVASPRGGLSREEVFSLFNLADPGQDVTAAA